MMLGENKVASDPARATVAPAIFNVRLAPAVTGARTIPIPARRTQVM